MKWETWHKKMYAFYRLVTFKNAIDQFENRRSFGPGLSAELLPYEWWTCNQKMENILHFSNTIIAQYNSIIAQLC